MWSRVAGDAVGHVLSQTAHFDAPLRMPWSVSRPTEAGMAVAFGVVSVEDDALDHRLARGRGAARARSGRTADLQFRFARMAQRWHAGQ
jgi:hypothetical protein